MADNPVEINRLWYRARFDENGVTIGRKKPISWDRIPAVGVDMRLALVALSMVPGLNLGGFSLLFARPSLHLCVPGDRYPVPVPAVLLPRRKTKQSDVARQADLDRAELRKQLGSWLDRVPVVCPPGELGMWWVAHEGRPPVIRNRPPAEPTSHERVVAVEHELEHLQHELDKINLRKKHDL